MGKGHGQSHRPSGQSFVSAAFNGLASVRFAVLVVSVIAVACISGTLLPQGVEVAAYVEKNPAAAGRMELFGKLGLTHVFSSCWFIGLLCVLTATVATCSTRRFRTIQRTTGAPQRRAFGSLLTHISILLILAGGVIRGFWGEKGQIELREGEIKSAFQVEQGSQPLPFALQLAKFEIETYGQPKAPRDACEMHGRAATADCCNQLLVQWPERNLIARLPIKLDVEHVVAPQDESPAAENSFRIKILKYIPDFVIDLTNREVTSRSDEPRNPAILVQVSGPSYQNHRWLFAKFPEFVMHTADSQASGPSPLKMFYQNHGAARTPRSPSGPIKNFKSTLKVIDGGEVVQTKTVQVNSPFQYRGYTFYQSGYNPQNLAWTSLQVVRDPGVSVVYAGFSLLILGLFIVFYLNPWLETRRAKA